MPSLVNDVNVVVETSTKLEKMVELLSINNHLSIACCDISLSSVLGVTSHVDNKHGSQQQRYSNSSEIHFDKNIK